MREYFMEQADKLLKEAITGEFNAIQRYKCFAETAEQENLPNVAYLFKALAAGELVHLENHKRALAEDFQPEVQDFTPGTTIENLKSSLNGETKEFEEMYPRFIKSLKRAKKEHDQVARLSMQWARDVEKTHAMLLKKAIERVEQHQDYISVDFWVCSACGNLRAGENASNACSVCRHDGRFFKKVE